MIPARPRFPRSRLTRSLLALLAVAALVVPSVAAAAKPSIQGQTTAIRLLDFADWHGQLDPNFGVGGAEALSSYFEQERAGNPNTITLTGGDDFGASPPLSSFFDEVPAVLAERLMGVDVGTLGNHNFDQGIDHLQAMIDLAGSSSAVGEPYEYVSANLRNRDAELSGVKDYEIFKFKGVKVAVIGITNPEAPGLVFPGNFGSIVPSDPVAAAMRAQAAARKDGAKVFIALTHLGIEGRDAAGAAFGPLLDFANGVSGFTVIFGDHTNFQYQAEINGQLVIENLSKGASYSRTDLVVRRGTGALISRTNAFMTPTAAGRTDPAIAAMLQPYRDELAPILNVRLGASTVPVPRSDACGNPDGRTCESLLGDVVTDAMRLRYGADFAITNAGGLRAALTCPTTDNPTDFCAAFTPPPYPITRGQTFGVLPFGNFAVTVSMSGAELKAMLENGVSRAGAQGRFPQVSGLCFTYNPSAAVGSRVIGAVRQAADGSCTGAAVDLTASATYLVAMNDFMATGGDGYGPFATSRINSDGTTLEQTLADYIVGAGTISPSIQGRITCASSGSAVCPIVTP